MEVDQIMKSFLDNYEHRDIKGEKINIGDIISIASTWASSPRMCLGIVTRTTKENVFFRRISEINTELLKNNNKIGIKPWEDRVRLTNERVIIISNLFNNDAIKQYNDLNKKADNKKIQQKMNGKRNNILLRVINPDKNFKGFYILNIKSKNIIKKDFVEEMKKIQNMFKDFDIYVYLKNGQFSLTTWQNVNYSNIRIYNKTSKFGFVGWGKDVLTNILFEIESSNPQPKNINDIEIKYSNYNPHPWDKNLDDHNYFTYIKEKDTYFFIPNQYFLKYHKQYQSSYYRTIINDTYWYFKDGKKLPFYIENFLNVFV